MNRLKYTVESYPDYQGYITDATKKNHMYAEIYILEENACDEYFATVTAKEVKDDKLVEFTIEFTDFHNKTVSQPYREELFEAIYESSVMIFKGMTEQADSRKNG